MRLSKTKNRSGKAGKCSRKYLTGFTLMELLIAATIFAAVLVIATGILGQSSSFRGKIKATREVSEDTKRLADMITRDVRSANITGTVRARVINNNYIDMTFKNGLALLNCPKQMQAADPTVGCYFVDYSVANGAYLNEDSVLANLNGGVANTLIIFSNASGTPAVKVYYSVEETENINGADVTYNQLYYREFAGENSFCSYYSAASPNTPIIYNADHCPGPTCVYDADYKIKNPYTDTRIIFNGYTRGEDGTTLTSLQQPFIKFFIRSRTKNYVNLPPNSRAKMEIRSSVTARSFAN